ncbi:MULTISPECIES: bifunctional 2-polyprenyl-6-hydroxyphenol methylase/3-demethylubiquinol 3-O-methyltransferase UbiG [unclassified Corynebacterium]|uniref:class I SAM-dependent methyltransferase n=1 Tax=unclassified Corynebacterium TaxID=2624378 RepID=UPI0021680BB2|nr:MULTISPECIES: class I SAM-dependent methyltransferase [unclassified Corynebacterium]MCS4490543.1 class I SAM-dependent methyltransferase [Corynebacterium sp. ES2775-CONJ]MCS4492322.1 class I SAM-dependent methyltransferase [Corynebacterium sp. ES2715-CONJ3]MCS4532486.1 class I SAM-dependent methyltransferase [Corynebacterium sp. ES2730-CONJ]
MPTWKEILDHNPNHSEQYAQRWYRFQAEGRDIVGEARLIDALAPRGAKILDAGCGTGRIGGYLSQQGHHVVGTDLDPVLIDYARKDYPEARWEVGDLCVDPLPGDNYDLIVSAGNVMGFLPPEGRLPALKNIARVLSANGRAVIGFGIGRGWLFPHFLEMAREAGFKESLLLESWDGRPFEADSEFLVAVLEKP